MAYTRSWDVADPATTDPITDGAQEIRELKEDVEERFSDDLLDLTGTRTIDTDPIELSPNKIDTACLDIGAGGWNAVARAVTYFGETVLSSDFSHPGPDSTVYANVTGLSITVPATVLAASGLLEHTNGTAITTTDYAIYLEVGLLVSITSGGASDFATFKVRNTTDAVDLGIGGTAIEVRTLFQSSIGTGTNSRQWLTWKVRDAARTAATTYQVMFKRNASSSQPVVVEGAETAAYIIAQVFKR